FEPLHSSFWILKIFDTHSSIQCNKFSQPSRMPKSRSDNIRKSRNNSEFQGKPFGFIGCEFTIVETFHVFGVSLQCPSIQEHFRGLILDNSFKHFQESPSCLLQRELPRRIYVENTGRKMHLLLYGHFVTFKG